jgi:hypothetical protein
LSAPGLAFTQRCVVPAGWRGPCSDGEVRGDGAPLAKEIDVDPDSVQPSYDANHDLTVTGLFDADYYLATNPDVRDSRVDPLAHFMEYGWREGRNPSRDFDVAYYRRVNPDVEAVGLNPLVHYAWAGAREGRLSRRPLDAIRGVLEAARAPSVKASDFAAAADHSPSLDRSAMARALRAAVETRKALVVSVSHDDYQKNFGGVQNVIRNERLAFEQINWAYLHLSPAAPLPMLAEITSATGFRFGLRVGSEWLGVAVAADLIACLAELRSDQTFLFLVIHHLMGHAPEVLLKLAEVTTEQTIIWVHDYFTLCPNFNLLRNDVRFCGAPSVVSAACGICVYGINRADHLRRVHEFFEAVQPMVLAPSEAALDFWCRQANLPHRAAHVQPLARLVLAPESLEPTHAGPARPLRVAHLGMRSLHKGWVVFEDLALRFAMNPAYAFYQIGLPDGAALPRCIRNVHVQVSDERPDSMVEAIAQYGIDIAIIWSVWPETFCFAVHEALAGGALVLARAGAGNVAHAIVKNAPEQGYILENEAVLFDIFDNGRLKDMLDTAHRRRGVLIPESGSANWLRQAFENVVRSPSERPSPRSYISG